MHKLIFTTTTSSAVTGMLGQVVGSCSITHDSIPTTDVKKYDDKMSQVLICRFDTIKMIVSVIYIPPDVPTSSFQACMNLISSYIDDKDDYESCIISDFNLPDADY